MFLNDKYIVVFLINNYAIEERRGSDYMMKKLLMVLFCFPILCNINVFASEYVQDELLEEDLDLTEEIEMFDSFYQQPDRYIFQDINGDDLNGFVMQYKDEFYKDQYQTTDFLMEYVRSVQDLGSVISYYSGRSKTWANQKVYYTKTRYNVYSATGSCTVTNNKITSGKCSAKIVSKNNTYSILRTSYSIGEQGKKITFTITHSINNKIITTKHTITI